MAEASIGGIQRPGSGWVVGRRDEKTVLGPRGEEMYREDVDAGCGFCKGCGGRRRGSKEGG